MQVKWTGPPEHEVGLIGVGLVTPGDVLDLDDAEAATLVEAGRAEYVEQAQKAKKSKADKAADKTDDAVDDTAVVTDTTDAKENV